MDSNNAGDCKAIADLDGDGKNDPIVAGGSLCWYESGASFAKRTIRSSPAFNEFTTDMQAADVDGDGDIDLIIPDSGPNNTGTVLWYENPRINPPAGHSSDTRIGSNWVSHTIGTQGAVVHDVEVADLDNDGKLDIVTSGHGVTRIWKQNSPTSWTNRDISSLAGDGVFLGDIDRDGFKDIATPRGWLRSPAGNLMGGTWTSFPINLATGADECLLADFDGDGRLDLMICSAHSRAQVYWFQQPATATSPSWTRRSIDSKQRTSTSMGEETSCSGLNSRSSRSTSTRAAHPRPSSNSNSTLPPRTTPAPAISMAMACPMCSVATTSATRP
jgi:hypothetical protein